MVVTGICTMCGVSNTVYVFPNTSISACDVCLKKASEAIIGNPD